MELVRNKEGNYDIKDVDLKSLIKIKVGLENSLEKEKMFLENDKEILMRLETEPTAERIRMFGTKEKRIEEIQNDIKTIEDLENLIEVLNS